MSRGGGGSTGWCGALHGSLGGAAVLLVSLACTGVGVPAAPATADRGGFSFAVLGDTPYSPAAERLFPALAAEVAAAGPAFTIHVGDVKGSWSACSDSLLASRIRDLDALDHPVVFVPGDNDWTDCHRADPGSALPLERLAYLRSLAYAEPGRSLGARPIQVETQASAENPEFPEHQRWSRDGVWFATLHVVGSRNGLDSFAGRSAADDDEVARRIEASVSWLRGTFAGASSGGARAVVIAFQANPWIRPADPSIPSGFDEILAALEEEAARFAGPVLLIHGDSHTFRVDRPFWSEEQPRLPHVMRLETFGAPDVGWVLVTVEPGARDPFGFQPLRIPPR